MQKSMLPKCSFVKTKCPVGIWRRYPRSGKQ